MKNDLQKINLNILIAGFLLFLMSFSALYAQSKAEKIEKLMQTYHKYGQFNGSVLVAENGKVIYKDGLGMANMEWDIPNTANTKHRLGSITKQFTASLIMLLAEEGKLDQQKPVSTYLPDYPKPMGDEITIHHLLTHTSGIPNYTSFPGFFEEKSRDPYKPEEFVETFADSSLQFTPGEKFAYSNSGYFLLGYIIEKVTGKPYEEVLQEKILTPLGMKDTGYDHQETILKNRASGYEKTGNGYRNAPYLDMSIPYAAGSLYSTAEDLYKWDQALYTGEILSEASKKKMFTPQVPNGSGGYGYGWGMNYSKLENSKDSILTIGHGGGINGFNTNIIRVPEDRNLLVLLNNTGGANLSDIGENIKHILYNESYEQPKKSVAKELLSTIAEQGLEAALARFKELKSDDQYALRENEINIAGYQLLRTGMTKEAIAVFKLNVEEFPESGNVYDSLGEAYMEDGNIEMAIKNYEKSVEIDPGNNNGAQILKDLKAKRKSK
ncbi:serine hydrolase [Salegentibacter chungangensis]|uniref:Serine hydrolase n=1 Tax=Salegentibacter chungangensis TaxID=1335724 RepID=A0ABW3NT47_9FLAO